MPEVLFVNIENGLTFELTEKAFLKNVQMWIAKDLYMFLKL